MSRLTDILRMDNHAVAVYGSESVPADAVQVEAKCCIPTLLMRCTNLGGKIAADRAHVACHGAKSGLGFGGIPDRVRTSCSLSRLPESMQIGDHGRGKRYFADPECAMFQISGIRDYDNKAIVFQDLEEAEKEGAPIEVVVFTVDPTRLSALMQLAAYSRRADGPACITPFGFACQQIYALPRAEGESDDPHAVIGMTDMYARRYVGTDRLTFAVPYAMYRRMLEDIPGSFLEDERYIANFEKALRLRFPVN